MPQKIKIFNGKVILSDRIIPSGSVLILGNRIIAVEEGNMEVTEAIEIDAKGKYISPGFIDIHIHGGGGYDFMDESEIAFLTIAKEHVKYGTTAMVPTTLTSDKEGLIRTLEIYEQVCKKNDRGAQFLGMHLEGPYFAMSQRGAQMPQYIRNPDPAEYESIINRFGSSIKRWSAAPELMGAIEFGKYMCKRGVIPAIAHSDAVYEEVFKAFQNGFTLATHLYSGMSGVTRRNGFRYAGVVESAFLIDTIDVEIIADGVHLPAPLLKLVYKIKGPDRIALITDAMRGAGTTCNRSILGNLSTGLEVIIEDGVAKLTDRTAFAGSIATTNRLVRTMLELAEITLLDAVKMATLTPARIMGVVDKKGSLAVGKDADIIIFNEEIEIGKTIVQGNVVYDKDNF